MSTGIEWTDETWNPTTGCDRCSPGCDHCYALTLAGRLKAMGQAKYQNDGDPRTSGPGFGLTTHPDALEAPLRWRKPRRVFVNSMSDLFHPDVPIDFIAEVWAVMVATGGRHTFQVLTKRPQRMAAVVGSDDFRAQVARLVHERHGAHMFAGWPYPSIWLGTSVENQRYADLRIPHLLNTPAAVRFLSCEPLLGPVDLAPWVRGGVLVAADLDWCIVGGESGPGARPMHPTWVRSLRDQCSEAGVPFFFKQWGEWLPLRDHREHLDLPEAQRVWDQVEDPSGNDPATVVRVGKKDAGRELDGVVHDAFPEAVPA